MEVPGPQTLTHRTTVQRRARPCASVRGEALLGRRSTSSELRQLRHNCTKGNRREGETRPMCPHCKPQHHGRAKTQLQSSQQMQRAELAYE